MFNWHLYENPEQDLETYTATTRNSVLEVSRNTKTLWTTMDLTIKLDGVELHHTISGAQRMYPKEFGERETLKFLTDLQKAIADEIICF